MSGEKKREEISIGPPVGGGAFLFQRLVEGEVVETGIGTPGLDPNFRGRCIAHGPLQENGRREVEGTFYVNSGGSVCHSGGNSRAFVSGWEQTFGKRVSKTAKAN